MAPTFVFTELYSIASHLFWKGQTSFGWRATCRRGEARGNRPAGRRLQGCALSLLLDQGGAVPGGRRAGDRAERAGAARPAGRAPRPVPRAVDDGGRAARRPGGGPTAGRGGQDG